MRAALLPASASFTASLAEAVLELRAVGPAARQVADVAERQAGEGGGVVVLPVLLVQQVAGPKHEAPVLGLERQARVEQPEIVHRVQVVRVPVALAAM